MTDVLLDTNDDLIIANGDFKIGEGLTQEVGIILRLNQGDLKSDPLLGPNLIRLINSSVSEEELKTAIKVHLERDRKDYEALKHYINLKAEQL